MLHSLQVTKCDALLLLLLLQPTQTKFKQQQPQQQQKTTQFKYENSTKASRLHFSDLKYIYVQICLINTFIGADITVGYIHVLQLIEILRSVTNGP